MGVIDEAQDGAFLGGLRQQAEARHEDQETVDPDARLLAEGRRERIPLVRGEPRGQGQDRPEQPLQHSDGPTL